MNLLTLSRRLLVLLIGVISCQQTSADEFRDLFNGQDLAGWVRVNTPEDTWSFKDGMLICTGKPIGEIRTDRMYQNFILELEWRHLVPKGNAGIFVWADDLTARGVPFHRGIEVQVLENAYGQSRGYTTHGDIFPIHGATMKPVNGRGGSRAFPTEERSNASPEWNHYRIECRDGNISLAVNGKLVTQGMQCNPRKGYICIESEGGVVHYRNFRIRELPATPISEDLVAIRDRGFQSLYSGLDLRGWKLPEGSSSWKSNDWVLTCDHADRGPLLTSEQTIASGTFLLDVKPSAASESLTLCGLEMHEFLQSGKWHRVEIRKLNADTEFIVDGTSVAITKRDRQIPLTIRTAGAADFANLFFSAK